MLMFCHWYSSLKGYFESTLSFRPKLYFTFSSSLSRGCFIEFYIADSIVSLLPLFIKLKNKLNVSFLNIRFLLAKNGKFIVFLSSNITYFYCWMLLKRENLTLNEGKWRYNCIGERKTNHVFVNWSQIFEGTITAY